MRVLCLLCFVAVAGCDNDGPLPEIPDLTLAGGAQRDLASGAGGDSGSGGSSDLSTTPGADLASVMPTPDLAGVPPGADLSVAPADLAGAPGDLALPPPGADPNAAGPLQTASFSLSAPVAQGIALSILVFGPSDDGKTLSMKGAPYPTVILSPGFQINASNYAPYGQRLASHGFLVVAQSYRSASNHPQNRDDTLKLIDWLLAPGGPDAGKLIGRTDGKRIGATGHSLGGKVTLLAAQADPRIVAAFGIDPVNSNPPFGGVAADAVKGLGGYAGRTGFVGETTNSMGLGACAPAADNFQQFYKTAAAPSLAITFNGANHNDFLDQANCLVCGVCFGGNANKAQTLALSVKYATAFFRQHLLGDAGMADYLTGMRFAADAKGGAVSEVTK